MFFVLANTLGFLVLPSNFLIVLALLGVVLMVTPLARAGRRLCAFAVVLLAVLGFSPIGNILLLPLEERFPQWDASRGAPDGIVVLGGAINPVDTAARGAPALNESAERLTVAVELARRYPQARIIHSGGDAHIQPTELTEAEAAHGVFESLGMDLARVELDAKSRNTAENARFSRAVAQPKPGERWLLVTSASHMPRAIGAFRQAGFPVEAHPVDWRTGSRDDAHRPFRVLSAGLARTDNAVREWVGLFVYWLTGRTSALFPGP